MKIISKKEIQSYIGDLIYILVPCMTLFAQYGKVILNIESNVVDFLVILIIVVEIICIKKITKSNRRVFMCLVAIVAFGAVLGIVTGAQIDIVSNRMMYFVAYLAIAFLLSNYEIEIERIITGIMICAVPIFFMWSRFWSSFQVDRKDYTSASMTVTYAVLPCIICFILHFIYYREKKIGYIFLYIMCGVLTFRIITTGTRGALLGIVLLILYIIIDKLVVQSYSPLKVFLIVALAIALVVLLLNLNQLIIFLFNYLNTKGITINIINKSYQEIMRSSNFLNGRDSIWEFSLNTIARNPIGVGIGYIETEIGIYTHNIFLELLAEYGWIIGTFFGAFIIYTIVNSLKYEKSDKVVSVFLFMNTIPQLLVSSTIWKEPCFWLLIFHEVSMISKYKQIKIKDVLSRKVRCKRITLMR